MTRVHYCEHGFETCQNCHAEITLLRAEVERLKSEEECPACGPAIDRAEKAERECDEALLREASIADLLNTWARESGITIGERQEDAKIVADRLWAYWSSKYHEALAQDAGKPSALDRGVLNKLQRAEAVMVALRTIEKISDDWFLDHKRPPHLLKIREIARLALAAWEERSE